MPTNALDLENVDFGDGNGLCDFVDPSTNQPYGTFSRDGYRWIQCRVVAQPGFYNLSVVVGNGVGRAWQHSHSFYLGPMGRLIMFEVFPGWYSVSLHIDVCYSQTCILPYVQHCMKALSVLCVYVMTPPTCLYSFEHDYYPIDIIYLV